MAQVCVQHLDLSSEVSDRTPKGKKVFVTVLAGLWFCDIRWFQKVFLFFLLFFLFLVAVNARKDLGKTQGGGCISHDGGSRNTACDASSL